MVNRSIKSHRTSPHLIVCAYTLWRRWTLDCDSKPAKSLGSCRVCVITHIYKCAMCKVDMCSRVWVYQTYRYTDIEAWIEHISEWNYSLLSVVILYRPVIKVDGDNNTLILVYGVGAYTRETEGRSTYVYVGRCSDTGGGSGYAFYVVYSTGSRVHQYE